MNILYSILTRHLQTCFFQFDLQQLKDTKVQIIAIILQGISMSMFETVPNLKPYDHQLFSQADNSQNYKLYKLLLSY